MRVPTLAALALLTSALPALSATIHVSPDASGDYPTIQAAIDAAASGDEIVLSDGVFTGDGNWDLDFGTKELVLRSVNGYEATTIDCGFHGQEVLHSGMTLQGGQTNASAIEGLTIEAVLSEGDTHAIRCLGSSPTIQHVRIRKSLAFGNVQGLGIYVEHGGPIIEDSFFGPTDWRTGGDGAAIFGRESLLTIRRCSFVEVDGYPVVHIDGGSLEDCTFDGCRATEDDQGQCVDVSGGNVSILRSSFRGTFGISVGVEPGAQALIDACDFEQNGGDNGAGVLARGQLVRIRNTTFRRNLAGFSGSAVFANFGSLTMDHCVLIDNYAAGSGYNGTVVVDGSEATITHCTLVRSTGASRGSAVEVWSGAHAVIDHTIVAFGGNQSSTDGAIFCGGTRSTLAVTCTDIYGNLAGDWVGCLAGMSGANGNVSADPLFCSVSTGNLSLQPSSPCAAANSGACGLIGAIGVGCGATALQEHTWGSIKALYR